MSGGLYDRVLFFLLIGDPGVGKSTLLSKFAENGDKDNNSKVVTVGEQRIKIMIWDVPQSARTTYYRGCHGIILVYDASSKESIQNLPVWLAEFEALMPYTVKAIAANKIDLCSETGVEATDSLPDHAPQQWKISAKTGANVDEMFIETARLVLQRNPPTEAEPIQVSANPPAAQENSSTCGI